MLFEKKTKRKLCWFMNTGTAVGIITEERLS